MDALLSEKGVRDFLIRPAHPWTGGRIERLFRTFKETLATHFWLVASYRKLDGYCRDFRLWYCRDRPHSAWDGKTPDEVFFDKPVQRRPLGRVTFFDGRLAWYRFGA